MNVFNKIILSSIDTRQVCNVWSVKLNAACFYASRKKEKISRKNSENSSQSTEKLLIFIQSAHV